MSLSCCTYLGTKHVTGHLTDRRQLVQVRPIDEPLPGDEYEIGPFVFEYVPGVHALHAIPDGLVSTFQRYYRRRFDPVHHVRLKRIVTRTVRLRPLNYRLCRLKYLRVDFKY